MKQLEMDFEEAAAFGRLCVETILVNTDKRTITQPPSGGCVLKLRLVMAPGRSPGQPPSGSCVLKQIHLP